MLGVLLTQAGTELYANDGIFFHGPLAHLVRGMPSDISTVLGCMQHYGSEYDFQGRDGVILDR